MDGHVDAAPWRAAQLALLVRTSRVQSLLVRPGRAEAALLLRPAVRPVARSGWPEAPDDRLWLTARGVTRLRVTRHRPSDAALGTEEWSTLGATAHSPPVGLAFLGGRPGPVLADRLDRDLEMVTQLVTAAGLDGAPRWCAFDRPGAPSVLLGERDTFDLVLTDDVAAVRRLELTLATGDPATLLELDVTFEELAASSSLAEPVDLEATLALLAERLRPVRVG